MSRQKNHARKGRTSKALPPPPSPPAADAASSAPVDLAAARAARKGRNGRKAKALPERPAVIVPPADAPTAPVDAPTTSIVATIPPADAPAEDAGETLKLGPASKLAIMVEDLRPFLAVAPTKEKRHYLNGVYVHKVGAELRLVATDGHRLLVQSLAHGEDVPWLEAGLNLPAEHLARIVKYVGNGDGAAIEIAFGEHWQKCQITGAGAVFDVQPIEGKYPEYSKVLSGFGELFVTERAPLETAAISPAYMKSAGQIAQLLGAKGVYCYTGGAGGNLLLTFDGCPGVVLAQMGLQTEKNAKLGGVVAGVPALIGEAGMRGTLAALKAHETRNRKAARGEKNEKKREAHVAAADGFRDRIAAILAGLAPQLEHKPTITTESPATEAQA